MIYLYKAGFTLLELIIVLFIMAIGASIVAVSVSRSYEKGVLRGEVTRLHSTLRQARELSLQQRTPFTFVLEQEDGTFRLEKNGVLYGRLLSVSKDVILKGKSIVFLPKGNSTGGYITVTNSKGRGYFIEVDPVTGTAKVGRL